MLPEAATWRTAGDTVERWKYWRCDLVAGARKPATGMDATTQAFSHEITDTLVPAHR